MLSLFLFPLLALGLYYLLFLRKGLCFATLLTVIDLLSFLLIDMAVGVGGEENILIYFDELFQFLVDLFFRVLIFISVSIPPAVVQCFSYPRPQLLSWLQHFKPISLKPCHLLFALFLCETRRLLGWGEIPFLWLG